MNPEKDFVAMAMPPAPQPKEHDPPPPYPGVTPPYPGDAPPVTGPPPTHYGLPIYTLGSSPLPPDAVQLVVPAAPPPRDYVLWSLFNALMCNFYCLGFAALVFSFKSRDRLVMGDIAAARRYGASARRVNLCVIVVGIISIAIFIYQIVVKSLLH